MISALLTLGLLGLCAGSFVNALVWRVHEQEKLSKTKHQSTKLKKSYSILQGRSMCPHCRHELATKDLIPLLSWLVLRGKCRYCQKPISKQYPLIEAITAVVFVLSYIFWPEQLTGSQWLIFGTWVASSVGLIALLVYDFKWMLLPNRIIYPTFFIALSGRIAYILFYSDSVTQRLLDLGLSVLVASGIFWILFMVSDGRWIGFGDVRLGLITGTVLASPALSMIMIFTASLIGTIVALPGIISGKKTMLSRMAFGPFLIIATFLVALFGQSLLDWYKNLL